MGPGFCERLRNDLLNKTKKTQTDQVPTLRLPTKFDQGVGPGPGLCAYVAPAILGSKDHYVGVRKSQDPWARPT